MLCNRTALSLAFAWAMAAGSAWAGVFDASAYMVTNLGGVPNDPQSPNGPTNFYAYSLTDSGQVTGYGMQLTSSGAYNEVLCSWNPSTGFVQDLTTPTSQNAGGATNTPYQYNYVPVAGNNAGTVVWSDSNGAGHVWSSGAGDTTPSALSGQSACWINSSGLVVGGADPVGGTSTGIVYNSVTKSTVTLPGVGYYVNDAGQVGGTENNFTTAFVWSQTASNGWAQGVTNLSGMCWAPGISQNGRYVTGQDPTYTTGMLYDNGTKQYTTLGAGTGISVNNNGWVGGSTSSVTGNYAYTTPIPTAWLWDGTTLHSGDLSALLPSGYTAAAVMAVNDSDQLLVWGEDGTDIQNVHSFLLTPTIPGDANLDGRVNVNDLTILLSHFGQSGMDWNEGDFNGDTVVDVNDLTILLSNFGRTAAASGLAAVPEPGAVALLGAGLIGLWAVVRRKH